MSNTHCPFGLDLLNIDFFSQYQVGPVLEIYTVDAHVTGLIFISFYWWWNLATFYVRQVLRAYFISHVRCFENILYSSLFGFLGIVFKLLFKTYVYFAKGFFKWKFTTIIVYSPFFRKCISFLGLFGLCCIT